MEVRRRSAEQIADELRRLQESSADDRDRLSLLHEISVYQEELVVQNEALLEAQAALEQTRDRFIELYDFAPNGYMTLDANGVMRQCNLTAAALLGQSKQTLEDLPLLGFVGPEDRLRYFEFLRGCRSGQAEVETEIRLRTANGLREVQLLCRPRQDAPSTGEYFTSIVDVTERNRLEHDRAAMARRHAALAGRLISMQEQERQRIARDLHDDLGQQVTALRLKLEDLGKGLRDTASTGALRGVQEMAEKLDRRLHLVATQMRPAALDLGVVAALEEFVREWSDTFGVEAEVHAVAIEPQRLSPGVATHVYRIAQEALNNVAKHAAARCVTVLLERRDHDTVLVVEDDGRGFDAADEKPGLGFLSMRERAETIGARLDVESSPGRGTSVFLLVPGNGTSGGVPPAPSRDGP